MPQALQAFLGHRGLLWIEDIHIHRIRRQLLLHLRKQAAALLGIGAGRMLGCQVAEGLAVVAVVVLGVGVDHVVQRLDMVDHRQIKLAFEGPREPLRPFHILDLGQDADLGELRGQHLATLAGVLGRRQRQGHLQWRFDTRLFQQSAGFVRVIGRDAGQVHIARIGGGKVAANGHGLAVQHAVDEGLAVNGMGQSAAHAHIIKGLALVVDGHDALARRRAHGDRKTSIGLELLDALLRQVAGETVHITRQQGGNLSGWVADEAEGDLLELD